MLISTVMVLRLLLGLAPSTVAEVDAYFLRTSVSSRLLRCWVIVATLRLRLASLVPVVLVLVTILSVVSLATLVASLLVVVVVAFHVVGLLVYLLRRKFKLYYKLQF